MKMSYCNQFCLDKFKDSLDANTINQIRSGLLEEKHYGEIGSKHIFMEYDVESEGIKSKEKNLLLCLE